jgi:hypothetical protein
VIKRSCHRYKVLLLMAAALNKSVNCLFSVKRSLLNKRMRKISYVMPDMGEIPIKLSYEKSVPSVLQVPIC